MGKTTYCISNGSPEMFPNNTLTSFGNKFPLMYDYGKASNDYKLQVGVDSIGFSLNFKNNKTNKLSILPSVIFESESKTNTKVTTKVHNLNTNTLGRCDEESECDLQTEKLVLSQIESKDGIYNYRFIYFDNENLTFENLLTVFQKIPSVVNVSHEADKKIIKIKHIDTRFNFYIDRNILPDVKIKSNHSEHFSGERTTTNIEIIDPIQEPTKKLVKVLNLSKKKLEEKPFTSIYTCYKGNPNSEITIDLSNISKLKFPKIIKVRCKNIRDQIYNQTNEKDLIVFCPQISDVDNIAYFFHEFETRTYCTLENTILDHIYFELLNEHNQPLQLDTGVPTLLKLDIIAMEKYKKSFNIRVASEQNNRSNFSIKLPQTLFFNENWHVSLTSINLPNTFTTFSIDTPLKITFFYQSGDYNTRPWGFEGANFYDKKLEFEIPNKIYEKEDLLLLLNNFFSKNVDGIKIGEFKETTTEREKKTIIKFDYMYHGRLDLPEEIVIILGDLDRKVVITDNGIVSIMHAREYQESLPKPIFTKTLTFLNSPIINYYKPSYIMLYSDIIQPIAVSGIFMNIMKIFPTSPDNIKYVIKEFKNPEYLLLNNYEIKEMTFQLRNHTGELISFDPHNPNPVILNLHFSNY